MRAPGVPSIDQYPVQVEIAHLIHCFDMVRKALEMEQPVFRKHSHPRCRRRCRCERRVRQDAQICRITRDAKS